MATGHALKTLTVYLIFFIIFKRSESKNEMSIKKILSTDHLSSFYVGNLVATANANFKEFHYNPNRDHNNTMASISTSKRIISLLILAKPILLAKLSASLYLLSCGDVSSNPGPISNGTTKPKCNICERTIACNHRTVSCKSCDTCFHFKCAGLSVNEYRHLHSSGNSSWTCTNCLIDAFPDDPDESLAESSFTLTNNESFELINAQTPQTFHPKVLIANVQGIRSKTAVLSALIDDYQVDIIIACETYLTSDLSNSEILPPNFTTFRKDRNQHGGGLQ